jgi:hyaluronoglucosaminidase
LTPELGVIEGFYGKPWSWSDRAETAAFLAGHGYRFYLYAPKADPWLRVRWREPYPSATADDLERLAGRCRALGVRFGVGLSPAGLHLDFGKAAKDALAGKLAALDALGIQDLALLFDDMRGDAPGFKNSLADSQAEIVAWAAERVRADRLFVCPSYYSDDPVLDRVFGARPERYLERLGELLDPAVHLFWTGEEVCSRAITPGHLDRVAEQMRRKPFLWDNYPVNDGERMSRFLHVRGFTGRPAAIADKIAGHGINPSLQPTLTRVPALTLVESYARGDGYAYGAATRTAAIAVLGKALGDQLWRDVLQLQDVGLERLGEKSAELRARYAALDHPGAREVVAWLDGAYRITDAVVQAQSGEDFTG